MRKGLLAAGMFVMAFAIACGVGGCRRRPGAEPPPPVRIGYIKVSSCLPFFVCLEKGYFKDEGVRVEPVFCADSNEGGNALIAGHLDGVAGFGLSTLFSIEEISPGKFKIYLPCVETESKYVNKFLVLKNSPIHSVRQLKGKRVGTYEGTSLLKVLKLILEAYGLDPEKDVTIIQVGKALQIPSLLARQFHALFTIEPYCSVGLEKAEIAVLEENPRGRVLTPFPAGANAFSDEFITARPDDAKKIVGAFIKAVGYIKKNEIEAKALLPKYCPVEKAVAEKSNIYEWWKPSETDVSALQRYADLMLRMGELRKKIPVGKMIFRGSFE
jgi:NitT/TauT family transport system substrate-binding protein